MHESEKYLGDHFAVYLDGRSKLFAFQQARNILPRKKRTCKIRERPLHEPITDSVRLKLICEHLLADMSGEAGIVCKHMDIDFLAQLNCAHDTAHLYVS